MEQVAARASSGELATMTTTRRAHLMTNAEAARAHPVHLRAVVTYYDPFIDPRRPALFIADATGSIFVALTSAPTVPLMPGQVVDITGQTAVGDFAPIVDHGHARVVGQSHLPLNAPLVNLADMLTGNQDGQWVEVEAVVHSIRQVCNNVIMNVALRDGEMTAVTLKEPGADYASLIDAKVRIRGNEAPLFNHQLQMTGAHLLFPGLSTLRVEEAAAADPFAQPVEPVSSLLRYVPKSGLHRRVHIHGVVTLFWPGRMLCLQDGAQGLCADTRQDTLIRVGDLVDVVGFPSIGNFTPTLAESTYRRATGRQLPPLRTISADEALGGSHDAELVTIDGQLLGESRDDDDPTIILSAGGLIFTASLPNESMVAGTAPPEKGTWLRLTGICSVHSDNNGVLNGESFPLAKSFRIRLRSVDDVKILRRPSWWNAAHTLVVLVLASLIAALALAWIVVLRKRVKHQTSLIRHQLTETIALKDAAIYQATHDGLTGLNNRSTIFSVLHREFDLASEAGSSTGIIMLDLDHFKSINDKFGHAAGDRVLEETANRLLRAIRSSDFVGRYGGEEFLIVLPRCDGLQCRICAERIRLAIASEPIAVDRFLLSVTASLGIAVAISPLHTEQQTLMAADAALYHAKNHGRNQVVSMEPSCNSLAISATVK
jgi:diguanylate cyclase (GGDEF)-like protein